VTLGDLILYRRNMDRQRFRTATRKAGGSEPLTLSIVGAGKAVGVGGEPSIGVDYGNPDNIAITSFAGQNSTSAPVYFSSDRGVNWTQYFSFAQPPGSTGIPNDQVLDYGRAGILYATFLSFELRIYTGGTSDPTNLASWLWDLDGSGNARRSDFNSAGANSDQPWLTVAPDPVTSTQDNVYGAYDDFTTNLTRVSVANVATPGTLPIQFSTDVSMGVMAGFVNPGLRMVSDHTSGAVYAMHQTSTTNTNTDPKSVSYILNRTVDGGQTWGLNGQANGIVVATKDSTQIAPKFGTVNALLGGVDHLAVDPTNGDVYCVYGERDASGNNRLRIVRLTDNGVGGLNLGTEQFVGVTGSGDMQAALPSVAVNDNGTIGVMYDVYDGLGTDDFPQFSVHFATSNDKGVTWNDTVIVTFLSTNKDNSNARQRVLGDYQQLKSVGRAFYGAFTANQAALGGSATMGPAFFSLDENRKPVIDPIPDQTVVLGDTFNYQVSASDPDGDALTYTVSSPVGATISATGLITWTPTTAGVYTLSVQVEDPYGATATQTATIYVTAARFLATDLNRRGNGGLTLKFVIQNPSSTTVMKNVTVTEASLGGVPTSTPLPHYMTTIQPLAEKQRTLQFGYVPPGPGELRVFGTSSSGDFMFVGTVNVP
jgi:hypothetical protein